MRCPDERCVHGRTSISLKTNLLQGAVQEDQIRTRNAEEVQDGAPSGRLGSELVVFDIQDGRPRPLQHAFDGIGIHLALSQVLHHRTRLQIPPHAVDGIRIAAADLLAVPAYSRGACTRLANETVQTVVPLHVNELSLPLHERHDSAIQVLVLRIERRWHGSGKIERLHAHGPILAGRRLRGSCNVHIK